MFSSTYSQICQTPQSSTVPNCLVQNRDILSSIDKERGKLSAFLSLPGFQHTHLGKAVNAFTLTTTRLSFLRGHTHTHLHTLTHFTHSQTDLSTFHNCHLFVLTQLFCQTHYACTRITSPEIHEATFSEITH